MTNTKRIVLKVGSAVLTQDTKLATKRLSNLVAFIAKLKQKYEVILVSSGAVACGYTLVPLDKGIMSNKQVLASIGQPYLMNAYEKEFKKYSILTAQVLLSDDDFDSIRRLGHAKEVIKLLLGQDILPIINENDVISTEELVGDNDQLAAFATFYFDADILAILTDIDGYYDKNPRIYQDAKLQKFIYKIDKSDLEQNHTANTKFSVGGIVTKLKAADFLLGKNKKMFLTSGFDLSYAYDFLLYHKHTGGTLFERK